MPRGEGDAAADIHCGLAATALRLLAVRAEQATMPGIGFLNGGVTQNYAPLVAAFLDHLREAGFVEGRVRWLCRSGERR